MSFEYSDEWRDALFSLHKRLLDDEIEIYDELEELVFKAENTSDPRVVFTLAECLHKFRIEGLDESTMQTLGLIDPVVYCKGMFTYARKCLDVEANERNIAFVVGRFSWHGGSFDKELLTNKIFPLAQTTFSLKEINLIVEYLEELDYPDNGSGSKLDFYHFFKQQVEIAK